MTCLLDDKLTGILNIIFKFYYWLVDKLSYESGKFTEAFESLLKYLL